MSKTGVILVNLGTPDAPKPSTIRPFLRRFLSDKRVVPLPWIFWQLFLNLLILPFRPKKLAQQYSDIWMPNGSPLEVYTRELTQKLQHTLVGASGARPSLTWHYAMSYSAPFLKNVIQECLEEKVEKLIILPLYPQYASSTTGAVFDQIFKALRGKCFIPELILINSYYNHPAYIEALAQSVKNYWQQHGKPQRLVMSFHGIPQNSVAKGDPYAAQCEATARALADALSLDQSEWQWVYQSRFGKARWLQPYCDKTLGALPAQGIVDVQVICPGFAVDCLETLEEVAQTNKQIFLNAGGKSYAYISALNISDQQCKLMLSLIES